MEGRRRKSSRSRIIKRKEEASKMEKEWKKWNDKRKEGGERVEEVESYRVRGRRRNRKEQNEWKKWNDRE